MEVRYGTDITYRATDIRSANTSVMVPLRESEQGDEVTGTSKNSGEYVFLPEPTDFE